ncbi:hypothetical protein H0H81_011387 [Sphagnurus paluster]|uniref:Aminoglycoside phosphotransferase domain-containing protein n=1 Tax=Sphagnurus paluster TaxID=117069 RepID=A0A9P7FNQ6_9AGAR|nr:hypothetical protein H0H81_011387 [Sphagnurus paluster]
MLSPVQGVDDDYRNFIVMTKLPGSMLLSTYGTWNTAQKERLVASYADIALRLFRLDVPQEIGTFVPGAAPPSPNVFKNIGQYIDFFFEVKRNSPFIGRDGSGQVHIHLHELHQHVDRLLADLLSNAATNPTLLHCVISHCDLNDMNILVDESSGHISGIVDWEYQILQPACLAAEYPPWLLYDCLDPRFTDVTRTLWLDSLGESRRLRELYLQIVKDRDPDYWNALVHDPG